MSLPSAVSSPDELSRAAARTSMFQLAELRTSHLTIGMKVRNLSATGLMGEADDAPPPGSSVAVQLRNIGWVRGTVMWKRAKLFGVHLDQTIDPAATLASAPAARATIVRRPLFLAPAGEPRRAV